MCNRMCCNCEVVVISKKEYDDYLALKRKNTPMQKKYSRNYKRCPVCNYVVDNAVPTQRYCDRCGQRLK